MRSTIFQINEEEPKKISVSPCMGGFIVREKRITVLCVPIRRYIGTKRACCEFIHIH